MPAATVTAPPLHALSLLLPGASFRSNLGTILLSPDATQMSALHWEVIGLLMVLSPTPTPPSHLPEPPTHSPASKPTAGLEQKDEHEPGHFCTGKGALRWRTAGFRPHSGAAGTGAGSQADTSPLWRPQFPFTEMGGLDSHMIAQWNEITSVKVLSRQALTSTVPTPLRGGMFLLGAVKDRWGRGVDCGPRELAGGLVSGISLGRGRAPSGQEGGAQALGVRVGAAGPISAV